MAAAWLRLRAVKVRAAAPVRTETLYRPQRFRQPGCRRHGTPATSADGAIVRTSAPLAIGTPKTRARFVTT